MTIELNDRHQQLIKDYIARGEFGSVDEVVKAALDQMLTPADNYTADELNQLIDKGVRDLDAGRVHTADEVDVIMAQHRATFLARRATP